MTECPDLVAFETAPLTLAVTRHVDGCASCQFVVELIEGRSAAGSDECSRFEALLAAQVDGGLGRAARAILARHLAGCAGCRAVAQTLAPATDAIGDLSELPVIDPAGYELGLEVARGGMGRILAARDLRIGRPVAVKELLGDSRTLAARFEREARVTARLQHPGVVPIYEIGRWPDGTPFYAMRMVDGRTLREAIADTRTLSDRLALLPAVIAATEAVAFAHDKRIIHRDLTPSNVLVGAYGETVVIDWGLAKDLVRDQDEDEDEDAAGSDPVDAPEPPPTDERKHGTSDRLTGLGAVIGTPAYMPPEQAHGQNVDERADVYALGAILYHVLAGPPYHGVEPARLLAAVRTDPPPAIESRARGLPRDLVSIVTKAMARDPAARYPSARELADELKRFHTGGLVAAHAYTTGERVRRFLVRHRAPALVALAAALVVISGATISVRRVLDSRGQAQRTARILLEDRGRSELLAGHPLKALAYLTAAYDPAARSPALDFMLARGLHELDDIEATLDCGSDVRFTAFSPDGETLAAACSDVARIWRLRDHALLHTLGPAPSGFDRLAYSADGRLLATIGRDGLVRIYDPDRGALLLTMEHHAGAELNRVAFTPDGRRLVTTGSDGAAVVWDTATGDRVHTLRAGGFGFVGVYGVVSPSGKTLLTATMGGVGAAWDLERGVLLGTVNHGSQILGGSISPDGTRAATCGIDRRARVWDLMTGALELTVSGHQDVLWRCVFSPDGDRLLTTGNDGGARLWDAHDGRLVTATEPGDIVWWGEVSPDNQMFVTANLEGVAQVWDARSGALLTSHDFAGREAHFSPDSSRLVMERGDGTIRIWSRPSGPRLASLAPPPGVVLLDASRDGSRAVMAAGERLTVWDTRGRRPLPHEPLSPPFALTDDGRRLAATTATGTAIIDLADGHTVARLAAGEVSALADDGGRLLTRGPGGPQIRDLATGGVVATFADATDAMLSGDGRQALAWRAGSPPTLWSQASPATTVALIGAGEVVRPLGFSADGTRVAVVTDDETGGRVVGVWRTDDGARLVERRIASEVAQLDPARRLLTSIGVDGVVEVIRLADGAVLSSFVGERLTRVQVDPSGTRVVATDKRDASVSVLDARDGRVLAQWPVQPPAADTSDVRFALSRGAAWWTPDGTAIVARAGAVEIWDADPGAAVTSARIEQARREVPWRVVDGQLRWVSAGLRGRVTAGGEPVGGAQVSVTIREVPRLSTEVTWATTSSRPRQIDVTTDRDGDYRIGALPAGAYSLIARSPRTAQTSAVLARTVSDLDQVVDFKLDRGAILAGHLRDGRGRPIAGAKLRATCLTERADRGLAMTAADGGFEFLIAGGCRYLIESAEARRRLVAIPPVPVAQGAGRVDGLTPIVDGP